MTSRGVLAACLALAALAAGCREAVAHETRPGYLEIREVAPGEVETLWKQPAVGELRLAIEPVFPADWRPLAALHREGIPGAVLTRGRFACPGGLDAFRVRIGGLETTLTDALVRVVRGDGSVETRLARPSAPEVALDRVAAGAGPAATFLWLGVEHILLGADHLLFVFGLLLLVRRRWSLVKTITAFTVAHSITLALAVMGVARLPAAPLGASIALSILFLGPEILRARRGEVTLTTRRPWVVAFAFGLLHGFGLAGGLADMGLPASEVPAALLLFNLGVEVGQLACVALILLLERSFRALEVRWAPAVAALPGYLIGALGAFWTIDRIVAGWNGVA
jgi:hypothetical protein